MPTFTLNRTGSFSIDVKGDWHCGVKNTFGYPITVRYTVALECEPVLDKRGFLVEQLNVDKFFQSLKTTSQSCEKLTKWCCEKLCAMIKKENPSCKIRDVKLTLSPAPHAASMTYHDQPSL